MHRRVRYLILGGLLSLSQVAVSQATPRTWEAVENALGRKGQPQAGGGMRFGMPRSDLKVMVGTIAIKPTLALGSWVAFDSPGTNARMMGDLVLTEDEVGPVMAALEQDGVEITALHNHVFHESPRVLYMHVFGHGDAESLARAVKTALSSTATPASGSAALPGESTFNASVVEKELGYKGKMNAGVLQFSVPRREPVVEHGKRIPDSMGISTVINFQPVGDAKAAVTGDFVLLGSEVNPVIRALQSAHIAVTALHSHMLEETPRLFFLHFWAVDDAARLAQGLRTALNQTRSAQGKP